MKRHFKQALICISAALLLTSCITIEENYFIKKDGSGSYEFKIDMSEMMSMMMAMGGPEAMGADAQMPTDEMDFEKEIEDLKKIDGISNIKSSTDQEKGIMSFSFDFKNFNALNQARANSLDKSTEQSLTKEGNKITLHHLAPEKLTDNNALPGDSAATQMAQGMLTQIKYNINFNIEGGAKTIITDANSNFETSNKEVFQLQGSLKDLTDTPDFMNAVIELN